MRIATINRKTAETDISLTLDLDGAGQSQIHSGCGFLDHMLTLFAKHGGFDLTLTCVGDTYVDDHHTVEDIGIALGAAFAQALGDKKGIVRYGSCVLPMDESLVLSAADLSGRDFLGYALPIPDEKVCIEDGLSFDLPTPTKQVGSFDTELVQEFFWGFVRNAGATLHIRLITGQNSHHIIEGAYKSVARSLRDAVAIDPRFADAIPSTKGVLQ
ncbi:MAG: imidazoleglycerol-phosphate dehydratase HisB [Ruminococcaceae bacterium]|nr:imidazoleglycerol-phosphate dehydratase HisB [Oscillospiraceae bacterium]